MNNLSVVKYALPDFVQSRVDYFIHDLLEGNENGKHLVLGKRPMPEDISLQSNDYLSLANHPEIKSQLLNAIDESDSSVFMSAIFLQDEETKPSLESQLADFVGFDHCLISQSGWNANTGLLQAICPPECPVYIDFFAHMSLWEGARYANGTIHPFMHNSSKHLRKLVAREGAGIILVDSIYSTLGTIAPLAELVSIAKEFGCVLVVDESHSLGTHGPQGAGLVADLGLTDQVDFITASLAKTFAYRAGAIWANNNATECIPFVSHPAIFSSTILPYETSALEATLAVIRKADDRRERLFRIAKMLSVGLNELGIKVRSESQIIALETGDEANTEKVRDFLEDHGVFGAVFCRPATPKNRNIIRFSVHSEVTEAMVDKILTTCYQILNTTDLYFK